MYDNDSMIILGAGPIGLWSAIKALENNFTKKVVVLDKRFSLEPIHSSWSNRDMVVQFHRGILSIPKNKKSRSCPHGVQKEANEAHRTKYYDLDHMSIKNIQNMLYQYLVTHYSTRFIMFELKQLDLMDSGLPRIEITAGDYGDFFNDIQEVSFVLDATGFHSVFMNKILGVPFSSAVEYGMALKITWPEHKVEGIGNKETEFHDCHDNSIFFQYGYSSVGEFAAPIDDANDFFAQCGYNFPDSNSVPFLEKDLTPFSIKLPPFIHKIINSKEKDLISYSKALSLFKKIRDGKLLGIDGFQFVTLLQEFNWKEADVIATVIRNVVNKNISLDEPYKDLLLEKHSLEMVRVVFVPSRAERWLTNNRVSTNVQIVVNSTSSIIKDCKYAVTACAVGDSLASTDFRHGLGVNRGANTALRIFRDKLDPEYVRKELVDNGYFDLDILSDDQIFDRAVYCRDWLLSTGV